MYRLKSLDKLAAIWCPQREDGYGQTGANVEQDGVEKITVSILPGPMGEYQVAVIEYSGDRSTEIIPLHMAETIILPQTTE
jgi:hypothetical protein